MKVLIWTLTVFTIIFLNALLGVYVGFQFGNVLLYIMIFFIARRLCMAWDEKQSEKSRSVFAASAEAEREATLPEGWYTCSTCGSLVRDGNRCSRCAGEASVPEEPLTPVEAGTEEEKEEKPAARYCRKCGAPLLSEGSFCTRCGEKIIRE